MYGLAESFSFDSSIAHTLAYDDSGDIPRSGSVFGTLQVGTDFQSRRASNGSRPSTRPDDDRFRSNNVPVTSITTSSAQNDAGMFEFSFRDERYLSFEGAGTISDWMIELCTEKELRQFDYSTITDVIMHIKYTAREAGGLFKNKAISHVQEFLKNQANDQPLIRMFDMKHDFPNEWHRFLYPGTEEGEQTLNFVIGRQRFPFITRDRTIRVMKIELFAKCTQAGDYHLLLSYTNFNDDAITSSQFSMPQDDKYGGLNKATLHVNDAGLNLEELDITKGISLKAKHSTAPDYKSLTTNPDEIEDFFLVMHYALE